MDILKIERFELFGLEEKFDHKFNYLNEKNMLLKTDEEVLELRELISSPTEANKQELIRLLTPEALWARMRMRKLKSDKT